MLALLRLALITLGRSVCSEWVALNSVYHMPGWLEMECHRCTWQTGSPVSPARAPGVDCLAFSI